MKPALIVHGGAGDIPDAAVPACKSGCERALTAGWRILEAGGAALDAIEAAVVILENDPIFDAGYGSHLNLDGRVECDAIIIDGSTLRAGAVATLQHVRNPVRLARKVLENCPHLMLVATGPELFAEEQGIKLCANEELVTDAEREAWSKCKMGKHASAFHRGHEQGTVGGGALEQAGHLSAAPPTGRTSCKPPGRVGDSPLIGCGCYADLEAGGVSCTGYGGAIMKIVMDQAATDFLRQAHRGNGIPGGRPSQPANHTQTKTESAMDAARASVELLARRARATGGLILLDRNGNPGWAFNTPRMAYGYAQSDGRIVTAV